MFLDELPQVELNKISTSVAECARGDGQGAVNTVGAGVRAEGVAVA